MQVENNTTNNAWGASRGGAHRSQHKQELFIIRALFLEYVLASKQEHIG